MSPSEACKYLMYICACLKLKTSKCLQNTFFHLKSGRSHSFLNNLPISLSSSSCQFPFSNNKQKQKIVYTLFKHLFTILNILIAVFFSLLSIFISKDKKKLIKNRMMVFFKWLNVSSPRDVTLIFLMNVCTFCYRSCSRLCGDDYILSFVWCVVYHFTKVVTKHNWVTIRIKRDLWSYAHI